MLFRFFLCVVTGLMFSSSLWAEPVDIVSESVNVDHAHSRAEFRGDVVLVQGDFTLRCDRLEAWYVKGDLDHAEAFDHVSFVRRDISGKSKRASYRKQEGVLVLFDKASVKSPEGTVSGEKITHNLLTETSMVNKTGNQRVHVVIDAEEGKVLNTP